MLQATAQTTRYVDGINGDDQGGANTCTDTNNPCQTINQSVSVATAGDTVEIADAVYTETLGLDFDITLNGQSEDNTIIQADSQPNQATERVVVIELGIEVSITNLTIRNGVATGGGFSDYGGGIFIQGGTLNISSVTLTDNAADNHGGAVYHDDSEGQYSNVTFINNETGTGHGGGMYINSSPQGNHNVPTLNNVEFLTNQANRAGGLYVDIDGDLSIDITNAVFNNNISSNGGGGMFQALGGSIISGATFTNNEGNIGGGLYFHGVNGGAPLQINNTVFNGNTTPSYGGGAYFEAGTINLLDVDFTNNTANGTAGDSGGGGLYVFSGILEGTLKNVVFDGNEASESGGGIRITGGGNVSFHNTLFVNNHADGFAGGIRIQASSPEFLNATFYGNTSDMGGGGITVVNGAPQFTNTIVWDNTGNGNGNEIYVGAGTLNFDYGLYGNDTDDVFGNFVPSNSITTDPEFVDAGNGDFDLTENSPAVNSGDPNTPAVDFPSNGNSEPIDIEGGPRFYNSTIDIGAYEWQDPLGVDDNTLANSISYYPNPVIHSLSITSQTPIHKVALYSITGEKIFSEKLHGVTETKLNMAQKTVGVYFLKVETVEQTGVYKIIKK